MSKSITDLRDILFDAIAGVRSGELPLDKAQTINNLSKTLVETAKAENDHIRATGGASDGSGFIVPAIADAKKPARIAHTVERTAHGTKTVDTLPDGRTVTVHKMRG
ncbi:MAG TPA: hypothetical protein PLZ60_09970 [Kiritimatiellia bacterium]|nr:hypothetical protein [Kiritimatiellia bacterium]